MTYLSPNSAGVPTSRIIARRRGYGTLYQFLHKTSQWQVLLISLQPDKKSVLNTEGVYSVTLSATGRNIS